MNPTSKSGERDTKVKTANRKKRVENFSLEEGKSKDERVMYTTTSYGMMPGLQSSTANKTDEALHLWNQNTDPDMPDLKVLYSMKSGTSNEYMNILNEN